ncbi:MAG: MarR family transcriptional regulator [Chloroflexota bacterium]|nr:MarR family transcriptional regulator [Chloroflexota bacterium]
MSNQTAGSSMDERVSKLQGDLQNLVQVLVEGLKNRLSPYGVDAVEYTVLSVCMAVGPTSIRDLRELVPIDYGHLSRTSTRLEDKGLLQKIRTRDDRRVVRLRVTEEGESLIPELMAYAQEYYVLLVRDISREELVNSMAVMQKMISGSEEGENHLAQAEGPPGPSADGGRTESPSIEALIGMLQGDLMKLVTIMYQGIEERVSPFGFAVGEFSVLAACFSNESITISGLAEHVPLDVGRISRLVSRLEDRGLVWKARPERDRRVVRVEMTDEGRALAVECMRRVGEHYANVVSGVSEEELTGLIGFIADMTANAEAAKG